MLTYKQVVILSCLSFIFLFRPIDATSDPLPSWNEGHIKASLLEFVQQATQEGGKNFIPIEHRIATFDQDGTLWVEQPLYTQLFFALDRIRLLAKYHPEWNREPFTSILSSHPSNLNHLSEQETEQIVSAAFTGMSVESFRQEVSTWLKQAVHPRFKRPFTDLVYQPMLELIHFLHDHQFKIYIVSGGGQEFIRAYAEHVYGIPPEHVIGSAGKVKYEYRNGLPILLKIPEVLFVDDKAGKPEGINLIIGRRPVAAFGNSTGDQQMLEWTQAGPVPNLELLVHHDDPIREYAYGEHSKIGPFPTVLMDEARKHGWLVVSMKDDWKVLFSWENKPVHGHALKETDILEYAH